MQGQKRPRIEVMTGNDACAEGALAAGLRFFAGYPITPSSEIAEILSYRLPQVGGAFIQMEDEIGAMGAVIGASLAGAKAMTATSGPGFSLKQENIGYAAMAEVPCVIVDVQRGGPSTGLPTLPSQMDVMQARWGTHGDHEIIALCPYSVRETFDLTVRAFNLAERFRTPVILLMDEIIAHVNEKVVMPEPGEIEVYERKMPHCPPEEFLPYKFTEDDIPPMASFGTGYRFHVTGLCHDETGFPTNDPVQIDRLIRRLNRKISRHRDLIVEVAEDQLEDAEIGVVAYGSTARAARRAVALARQEGIRVGLLRPLVLWPFPDKEVRALAEKVDHIIVPELNMGQVAHEVEWAACGKAAVHRLNRVDGEPIPPQDILQAIKEVAR
ncbi:MAG: 2-oxoacid:acceptor oxidoreductase subunit alpha [candidate division KSB1 bacterium]|nr:2-oxoacid:acceptor oxidoreductase subunit alpha [candidate division KSB1 bacterium]MDZ7294455.1 2-oxoacid:acceptor oxidoreductase subunit alpha [candidate division KSB1 bacterium]MDZ7378339.1 2-oxoacid:acceptor oxidoreductase subunit alpha [candidate division KSB1 bacterium]MDZ7385879.1 2-oxoacid:acceptor oxidoreductase subunit alpha [candidate division KSB1 bacterium]MDZ7393641.1 2-oxoacid:acceptor oxidoreductase subunit alpha [candidate division KSB1 bacterium]